MDRPQGRRRGVARSALELLVRGRPEKNVLHLGHGLIYPHLMLLLPHYDNARLGGNERRSGLPLLSDDCGTAFAVTIVPMDKAFAVKAKRSSAPARDEPD